MGSNRAMLRRFYLTRKWPEKETIRRETLDEQEKAMFKGGGQCKDTMNRKTMKIPRKKELPPL